jgi:hypothetical protein
LRGSTTTQGLPARPIESPPQRSQEFWRSGRTTETWSQGSSINGCQLSNSSLNPGNVIEHLAKDDRVIAARAKESITAKQRTFPETKVCRYYGKETRHQPVGR